MTRHSRASRLRRFDDRGEKSLHEEDVSAEPPTPQQDARVSPTYEDAGRSERAEAAAGEGPEETHRLSFSGERIPSRSGLQRSERLRRASEIQALFQQGNREERPSFVLLWHAQAQGRQVGFGVSRRVGGAVARNRVRRRIREAYRRQQGSLRGGVAVMFVGRPPALTRPFTALLDEMRLALESLDRAAVRMTSSRTQDA